MVVLSDERAPVWPDQFTMDFNETAKMFISGKTTGTWYYDASNNRQVIERKNGRHDRYCNSVFELQDTPCRHIVVASTPCLMQIRDSWTSPKSTTVAFVVIALLGVASSSLTGLCGLVLNMLAKRC